MPRIIPLDINNARHIEAAFVLRMEPDNAPGLDLQRELNMMNTPQAYAQWVAKLLAWHPQAVGLAMQGQEVVGFYECGTAKTGVENGGYLFGIHTAKQARGQGVGKQLLGAAETVLRAQGCTSYRLSTVEQNTPTHAFYQRMGLVHIGARPDKPYLWLFEKKL